MSVGAIRAGRAMVEIFADSSMLARGLASAQSKMARFAQTIRRLGTTQVVLGVGMAAPIAAAVRQYAQLEQRINTVRSLTGATVAQMRGLTQSIRQIGMETGRPFTEIADGMGELSRAGVRLQSLGRATRVIADFSRAAGVDMARASNIGVEILTQFGLEMEHLPRVADVLQEMANATVSTVEDLSDGFRYAGQTAKTFGLSLEQAGAAIAYLQQSGLSSTTAGTALNQMLLQMVQNLGKVEAAVGGLRGANGEFLPFADILGKLQKHIADMPGPERLQWLNEMFDVRGMRGAEALLKNVEAWMALTNQANGSMGASKRKATEMSKAFIVSFEQMRNGLVDFSYTIGEVLDADLRSAFQTLAGLATGLGPFIKANADAVRSVAKFAAILTVSGATFFTVGVSLQLLAFSFEGFVKASLAAYAPINGLVGLGKMLGLAFAAAAAQVTRAGAAITMSVTGLYAAVSRPIDASVAAVTALGTSFVSMSRTVHGAVGRAVASMGALNRAFINSIPAAGSAVRGAAAAAPRAVGAAAAGAAAATAGAGRAAAAPVAAAAAAQGAVAARGPLPMIAPVAARPTRLRRLTRLPRGPFGQMAPSGPRTMFYTRQTYGALPYNPALDMPAVSMSRRDWRKRMREDGWFDQMRAGRDPTITRRGWPGPAPQPTARQARIAELLAANRARRGAEASAARRDRMRQLLQANRIRRMTEVPADIAGRMSPRVPRSQLFTQSDDYARGLNPFQRAARSFGRSRGTIPRLARGMMTGFGRQTLGVTGAVRAVSGLGIGAAAMAVPILKVTAAIAAAAAAASLLRRAFGGIVPLARGLGGGLVKIFDGFASRAKEVWPETKQTVKAGWQGIVDSVKAGDLSGAWKIFADTAKAVFAQVMVVIGPFVDDVSALFADIGSMISKTFWGAVDVASNAFGAMKKVLTPVFNAFADVGDSLFTGISSVMPSVGSMLSGIADDASTAGSRIFEALSAGDIVKAWMAATTAISQMFARIASEWDKNVAAPIRLASVRTQEADREQAGSLVGQARVMGGNRAASRIQRIVGAANPPQLEGLARDARESGLFNNPALEGLLNDAVTFAADQFQRAGVITDEQRMAELNKTIADLDAAYKRRIADLDADRQANADRRRREADVAAAKVQAGAGTAAEMRTRKELERRVAEATTQEELDKAQKELDDMTAKAREVTAKEVGNPGGLNDNAVEQTLRGDPRSREEFQAKMRNGAKAVRGSASDYEERAKEQGASQEELDAVLAARERHASRLEVANTDKEVGQSTAQLADEIVGITKRFRGANASMTLAGRTISELEGVSRDNLAGGANSYDAASKRQATVNDARAKRAEELRVEAAQQRRAGDEQAAAKLDESAAAIEQAVDAMEAAEIQRQINEARQAIANEQGLRGQQAAAGGDAAAAMAKQLDSVGGFMSSAFDRMGYGSNLGERQAKAAEDAAKGINKLVGIVERNGGVFV